jgi:hypothetical protein
MLKQKIYSMRKYLSCGDHVGLYSLSQWLNICPKNNLSLCKMTNLEKLINSLHMSFGLGCI